MRASLSATRASGCCRRSAVAFPVAPHARAVGHEEPVRFELAEDPPEQRRIEPPDPTRSLAILGSVAAEEEHRDALDMVECLHGVVLMPDEGKRCAVAADALREILMPRAMVSDAGLDFDLADTQGRRRREFRREAMRRLALQFKSPVATQARGDSVVGVGSVDGVGDVGEALHRRQEVSRAAAGVEQRCHQRCPMRK
jgi:hypothetical protein